MRLTIVVPALNEAGNLAVLLPELLAHAPAAEVIVVDGGSRDGTPVVVAGLPPARLVTAPRGRARQMNAGARAATGDVLLFLHADTRLPDGAVAAIEVALDDPRVAGGRFDVRFDRRRLVFRMIAWFMNHRSRLSGIATGDQAVFVRRAVFDAMGGYADIPLMEDIDFTRRLKRRGRVAALRARVTTSARKWEREGALRTIGLMWALRALYAAGVSPARLHGWYYGRDYNGGREGGPAMIRVSVMYPTGAGKKFDHAYYLTRHMKLVRDRIGDLGLRRIEVDRGLAGGAPDAPAPYVAACHLYFDSVEAFQAAMKPHGKELFADVPNFTDIAPQVQISEIATA